MPMMTAAGYRESLRALSPRVFVDGRRVESVADEPSLRPGMDAAGVTYDFAQVPEHATLMTARQGTSGKLVNRMPHIDETTTDLLHKLEAVRLLCKESGCAQRYLAHDAFGGLIAALPGPDEDHNPETRASLSAVPAGRPDIPAERRLEVARLVEDLTASHQGGWHSVISLHGGGAPEAMTREIWRNDPVADKVDLVERLLDRGVLDEGGRASRQPGRCCATGCEVPEIPRSAE